MTVTRRGFFRSVLGGAAALPALHSPAFDPRLTSRRRDPRLTSRPRDPFREPALGATQLAPDRARGALLYVPASYSAATPAPLLVALHGSGGSATRWARLYETCDERGIVMLAPESRGRSWDRAVADFGPDVAFIDAALRYTFERCAIDPRRIALAGFSDGASYALSLGPSNGDLFTHLIAWSPGFSDPADPIVGLPRVFVSHGTVDRVLPVALSRQAIVPMFEMDGYEIEYFEFEGQHEIPAEALTRALDWFLG